MVIKGFDTNILTENSFVIIFIGINFISGMVNAIINAPLNASLQKYIEPNMIGKVSVLIDSFGGLLFPVTALITGYLLDNKGLYPSIIVMVIGIALITLVAFKSKELKKMA